MEIKERVHRLTERMISEGIDIYVVPSQDPHQSEYVAEYWKGREWISGFTGSAGTVCITRNGLELWTDSRYYLQAQRELQAVNGTLHKMEGADPISYITWICEQYSSGTTVAIDGRCFTAAQVQRMQDKLGPREIHLRTDIDLFASIWKDRPSLPNESITDFPVSFAGESREQKLIRLRQELREKGCEGMLLTALDDIAWTLNIRGSDVECNPTAYAYLWIHRDRAILFVKEEKVDQSLSSSLAEAGISIHDYQDIWHFPRKLSTETTIWLDPSIASHAIFEAFSGVNILRKTLPVQRMKAIKNEVEVQHIRHAMVQDGIALVRCFRWLEERLAKGTVKETELATMLAHFRSQQKDYQGESFNAIIGYEENGAIVHYRAVEESCAEIQNKGTLLVDSGGQYLNGTTDITRTFFLSEPTEDRKDAYTRVLKGHITLAMAVFPAGTRGVQLDILARQYLWNNGMNYGHGTGHGVGFYLNVHEPPQGIVPNLGQRGVTSFEKGMFTSNEPGYYKANEFGIRIENLILTVEKEENEHGSFLCFDSLTLYPIDLSAVRWDMMTKEEIKWLNEYHEKVYHALAPHLTTEEREWLAPQCAAIER